MFTGIIRHQGTVEELLRHPDGGMRLEIGAPAIAPVVESGSSVSLDGICLTVVEKREATLIFDVMPQTISLTTIHEWKEGRIVNMESALRVGEELGGHFVYGHVDGIGTLSRVAIDGNSTRMSFALPDHLLPFLVPQGSVTVNGISLTVVSKDPHGFSVSLIPETLLRTNLSRLTEGDKVNVEVDMMIKYLRSLYG